MKPKGMSRQDSRFDAALGADEDDVVTEIGDDAGERKGGHEMAASAAACDEEPHEREARNAERGTFQRGSRNAQRGTDIKGSVPTSEFRIPRSGSPPRSSHTRQHPRRREGDNE